MRKCRKVFGRRDWRRRGGICRETKRVNKSKQEYKEMRREAKKEVAKAKNNAYDELYQELDSKEGERTLYRLARQRPSGKGRTTGQNDEG